MQARKTGYLHGSVNLSTEVKGAPRKFPIWELRYRLPSGHQSDKSLGRAWVDLDLWQREAQIREAKGRPRDGFMTRDQAAVAAQAFLDQHTTDLPADRRTFARAWQDFLSGKERIKRPLRGSTLHEYLRIYGELAARPWRGGLTWAERPVATFMPEDATAVYEEMEARELAASTINHHRRIVRACIGTHITRDWPFLSEQTGESTGKLRFYDPDQVWRLKQAAHDDRDRAIFTLATEAGPRLSEILGLKVGNVDFEVGRMRIEDGYTARGGHGATKGHQVRSVPMSDGVRAALMPYCVGRDKDALVFSRDPQMPDEPLCGISLYRRFKAAARRADLPEIRFHELRHSFGTQAIRAFNIYEVQRMMGHRSITTTERYLHYAPDPDAAAKLTQLWGAHDNVVPLRKVS